MRRTTIRTATITTVTAAALTVGALAPASAASTTVRGDRGDMKSRLDIVSAKVTHTKRQVVTRIKVRKLTRKTTGRAGVYFDSRRNHPGSDYVTAVQLRRDKARLVDFERTKSSGVPIGDKRCNVGHFARYRDNTVVLRVPRSCLNRPGRVRVIAATKQGKKTDTAPNGPAWTRFVKRG